MQSIGLLAATVTLVLGAWVYVETQGKGPIGHVAAAYLQAVTDCLDPGKPCRLGAEYPEGTIELRDPIPFGGTAGTGDLDPFTPEAPDPSLADPGLEQPGTQVEVDGATLSEVGEMIATLEEQLAALPAQAKIAITMGVAFAIILLVAAVAFTALTLKAGAIIAVFGALVAMVAGVLYGLNNAGDSLWADLTEPREAAVDRLLDDLFDPYNLPGDIPYEGSVYQEMDQIIGGAYPYYGYDLAELADNKQDNPLTERMFFDYLGSTYVTDFETGDQLSPYVWLHRRLGILGKAKVHSLVLEKIGEIDPNNHMNYEPNYLAALLAQYPRSLSDARRDFADSLRETYGEDAAAMYEFLQNLDLVGTGD